jgi:hypothetical protein
VKIDQLTYHACNAGYSDLSCSPFVLYDGVIVSLGLVSSYVVYTNSFDPFIGAGWEIVSKEEIVSLTDVEADESPRKKAENRVDTVAFK